MLSPANDPSFKKFEILLLCTSVLRREIRLYGEQVIIICPFVSFLDRVVTVSWFSKG